MQSAMLNAFLHIRFGLKRVEKCCFDFEIFIYNDKRHTNFPNLQNKRKMKKLFVSNFSTRMKKTSVPNNLVLKYYLL
jgi:hypothetical protein